MLCSLVVCLLVGLRLAYSKLALQDASEIYLTDQAYPLEGFNFTLGVLADITVGQKILSDEGILHVLGTVCEAYKYNDKRGLVNISGVLNVQGMNTRSQRELTYHIAMQLLQSDLSSQNETIRSQIETPYQSPMGALVGSSTYDLLLSVAPYFTGFNIPVIIYTALSGNSFFSSQQSVYYRPFGESAFSINPSSSPELFNTIQSFMTQMNWTLAGILFEDSAFGEFGVQYYETVPIKNVTFVCSAFLKIFRANETVMKEDIKLYQDCLTRYQQIKVVVLWMSFINGNTVIRLFEKLGFTGYTFIIAYKQATASDPVADEFKDLLKYNFYLVSEVEFPSSQELDLCFENVIKSSFKEGDDFALKVAEYLRLHQQCDLLSNDESLEECGSDPQNVERVCLCTANEYAKAVNRTFRYSFAADGVATVAQGLYLLENNCTLLDHENPKYVEAFGSFCGKTSFSLRDLTQAITSVQFSGLTGQITLDKLAFSRRRAVYNVYQYNASTVGNEVGASEGWNKPLIVNFTAIQFANNQIPISGNAGNCNNCIYSLAIVPQIPTLSDALAAVFFGVFIALLLVALGCMFFIFWNRNDKIIRRSSPVFILLIGSGISLVLIGGLILTIGLTSSAMCILYVLFLILGLTLIISSLMAKTWRIYKIFNNRNASAVVISDRKLILFPVILTALSLVFCIIYCFATGALILDRRLGNDNSFYVFDLCSASSDWFQIFSIIFFYAYFFILFAITAALAFFTRHAHSHFRESKSIAMLIYIYVCMGIIYIPLYYVQGNSTESQNTRLAITCINIGLLMLATLVITFLPPILNFKKKQRRN